MLEVTRFDKERGFGHPDKAIYPCDSLVDAIGEVTQYWKQLDLTVIFYLYSKTLGGRTNSGQPVKTL